MALPGDKAWWQSPHYIIELETSLKGNIDRHPPNNTKYLIASIDHIHLISIDTHRCTSCQNTQLSWNQLRKECTSLRPHTLLSTNICDHLSAQKKLLGFTKEWRGYMSLWRLWSHVLYLKFNFLSHQIKVCIWVLTMGYLMIICMH